MSVFLNFWSYRWSLWIKKNITINPCLDLSFHTSIHFSTFNLSPKPFWNNVNNCNQYKFYGFAIICNHDWVTKANKFSGFYIGEFQQVCNDISTSVWESYKITMRISQFHRNLHIDGTTFLLDEMIRICIVKMRDRFFWLKYWPLLCNCCSQFNILEAWQQYCGRSNFCCFGQSQVFPVLMCMTSSPHH